MNSFQVKNYYNANILSFKSDCINKQTSVHTHCKDRLSFNSFDNSKNTEIRMKNNRNKSNLLFTGHNNFVISMGIFGVSGLTTAMSGWDLIMNANPSVGIIGNIPGAAVITLGTLIFVAGLNFSKGFLK